jgi:hypothetical protein
MTLDQGAGGLFPQFADVGGSAYDDIVFVPDDTFYIGYDPTTGVCGRPRQLNVTRRIDLGGTASGYEPVLNLLSEGSCTTPNIDGFLRGTFQSIVNGVAKPVELWGAGATLMFTGNPILIHSDKALVSVTPLSGSVILAGYEEVAQAEVEYDRIVEIGLEPGDGNNFDIMQYFAANRQLVATAQTGDIWATSGVEAIGYGAVPSANYQHNQTRAGLEMRAIGADNPLVMCLWGKKQSAAYVGTEDGVNLLVLADIDAAAINADHCVMLLRWRDNADVETDLFYFKDSEMEIVSAAQAQVLGTSADGGAAVGAQIGAENDFTTDGARLVEFVDNSTTVRGYVDLNGDLGINMLANGQEVRFDSLTELTTIAAAATTDTVIQIPAHCLVYAVSVRVTVVIPTAADFDVGVAGATDRYGNDILVAAGTTFVGTTDAMRYYASATSIRITPDASPVNNTGRVRVTIHFIRLTAPTS